MGTRAPINEIANLQNETSARGVINDNFNVLSDYIDDVLSLVDSDGNQMNADLDMNEQRIINLPVPTDDNEPARHGDLQQYVDNAIVAQEAAEVAQVAAELAETHAELAETNAETAETNAELAETNAETAQAAAEVAQAAAEAAQAAAEAVLDVLNLDSIDNLGDVVITTPSDNQLLTWDSGTSKWINETLAPVLSLDGLTDVVITSVASGHAIRYDGANWINEPLEYVKRLAAAETGANSNTAQPWFPANGSVSLPASTTFRFEGLLLTTRAAGSTSHTTGLGFAASNALTDILYTKIATTGDTTTLATPIMGQRSAISDSAFKAASTSTTEVSLLYVVGMLTTNLATTLTPQFTYSVAPGGVPTIAAGTFFRLTKSSNLLGTWA